MLIKFEYMWILFGSASDTYSDKEFRKKTLFFKKLFYKLFNNWGIII